MTREIGPIASAQRWRRVHRESGSVGLVLRMTARGLNWFANRVNRLADRLVLDMPYHFLTHPAIARELKALSALKGRHEGETIFILGTGPSLASLDLSCLAGRTTIIVNQGFLHAREAGLKPTYLAIIDELFRNHRPVLDGLREFCRANDVEVLCTRDIAQALAAEPDPPGCTGVHLIMRSRYFEATGRPLPLDFTVAQPGYESVIHFAIAASLVMGARQIVLIGCDMTYFVAPKSIYRHSYTADAYIPDDRPTEEVFSMDQVDLLELAHAEFRSFRTLRRMAEARDVRIVNATEGGYLEVFERASLPFFVKGPSEEPAPAAGSGAQGEERQPRRRGLGR